MRDINKIPRAFKLYKKLFGLMKHYEACRNQGNFGIACHDDELARKWQRLEFRTHVIECYITGEKINWFYARWLSNDEAERRNILNT